MSEQYNDNQSKKRQIVTEKEYELPHVISNNAYGILSSMDSDQHVQPPFKLRNSKGCGQ